MDRAGETAAEPIGTGYYAGLKENPDGVKDVKVILPEESQAQN